MAYAIHQTFGSKLLPPVHILWHVEKISLVSLDKPGTDPRITRRTWYRPSAMTNLVQTLSNNESAIELVGLQGVLRGNVFQHLLEIVHVVVLEEEDVRTRELDALLDEEVDAFVAAGLQGKTYMGAPVMTVTCLM